MLRSTTLGVLTALIMTWGGLSPATATSGPAARETGAASWGSTKAPDQVLRKGCRSYRFSYRITTPNNEWQAEMFITDPRGRAVGSVLADAGSDPRANVRTFRMCRPVTSPGRFKLRMRVSYNEGYVKHTGFVKPTFFRISRPR